MKYLPLSLLVILTCVPLEAQKLFINEAMSKSITALIDNQGSTPDWIEFYNADSSEINLKGFHLSDNLTADKVWTFPEVFIKPGEHLLVNASSADSNLNPKYWEAVINWGDTWKYSEGNSGIANDWTAVGFNDASWKEGATGIGYGDNDDNTLVANTKSVFARKMFFVEDVERIVEAVFHIDYDDGFAAYINGIEIARVNLGNAGQIIPYNYSAADQHEALIYQGEKPEAYFIDSIRAILHEGENVLAVQVHNTNETSSDLSMIPFLSFGRYQKPMNSKEPAEILDLPEYTLNANFALSSSGDVVYLMDPNRNLIDSLNIPSLTPDISYGRKPDGSDTLVYFTEPTPGSANITVGFVDVTTPVEFINHSGFYASQVTVEIANADHAIKIYYTTDGDIPSLKSTVYENPFTISRTTVVRAIAVKDGYVPSQVTTVTYLINENHELPVVSITTDPENLWDYNTGIYVKGPNAQLDYPYNNANFWQDWEKEAFIQFFETDKSLAFESNVGIKIFGGWSRGNEQKSLAVHARKQYGASSIKHNIFPSRNFNKYNSFILRNSGNDWGYTMFRDAFMQTLVSDLDLDLQAYRPALIFLNGEYWGIQNLREKINEDFLAAHHDVDPDEIDLLELDGNVIEGSNNHYKEMIDYINTHNMAVNEFYDEVTRRMDIDNFMSYMTCQIYFDNKDWPGNNLKFWRPQTQEGKWRWLMFDTDFGFGIYQSDAYRYNTLSYALVSDGPSYPNPPWSTFLLRSLLKSNQFKSQFLNKFADMFNTILLPVRVVSLIDTMSSQISNEISRHGQRWNTFNLTGWKNNINVMKNFARQRLLYLKAYYLTQFNINGLVDVEVNINNTAAGSVQVNSVTIINSKWSGEYFNGNAISITANPKYGYKFVGWQGDVELTDRSITVTPISALQITAVFVKDDSLPAIVINEINYNSSPDYDTEDWVELFNNSKITRDLSGWVICDSDSGNRFIIPSGTSIKGEAYIVFARDTSAFKKYFTGNINLIGNLKFGFNNGGDDVKLFDSNNALADSVSYDDQAPWALEPDGTGKTLSLINTNMDNSDPANWTASLGLGTPGKKNDVYVTDIKTDDMIVTEFRLKQNYPNPFNPVTTIEYSIPNRHGTTFVSLIVYDVLGRRVVTLVNENKKPGKYSVEFNAGSAGGGLTSGVYFYNLSAGSFNQTRKMILIK